MISIELIFPTKEKRLCARVDETISLGDFKKNLCKNLGINNDCIYIISCPENVSDDMSLSRIGMCNGSGVIIDDG